LHSFRDYGYQYVLADLYIYIINQASLFALDDFNKSELKAKKTTIFKSGTEPRKWEIQLHRLYICNESDCKQFIVYSVHLYIYIHGQPVNCSALEPTG